MDKRTKDLADAAAVAAAEAVRAAGGARWEADAAYRATYAALLVVLPMQTARAAFGDNGCPGCGGSDIDMSLPVRRAAAGETLAGEAGGGTPRW